MVICHISYVHCILLPGVQSVYKLMNVMVKERSPVGTHKPVSEYWNLLPI